MRRLTAACCAALAAAPALRAQEFLDAGAFVVQAGGTEAGREEFAIRPQGTGLLLVSTTRLPGREIQQALELTRTHAPVSFSLTESAGGRVVRRVTLQVAGPRVAARLYSADGEAAREFPARGPVAVLGDGAFAAFYFVPRAEPGAPRRCAVVRSTDVRLTPATVTNEGDDTVLVQARRVPATRYLLRTDDGDERRFWFSADGDLLQVAELSRGLVATRAESARR
jgi:hypothetical protein